MKLAIILFARLRTFQTRMESSFAWRALASAAGGLKTRVHSLACRPNDWRPCRFFRRGPTQESLRADRIILSCYILFFPGMCLFVEHYEPMPDLPIPGGWMTFGAFVIASLFIFVLLNPRCHETLWRKGVGWDARKNRQG